jgi:dTDP-4-amino-4,6-dideoxygalactose transaminase
MIPIAQPLLGEEERAAVARVLATGRLAQGPKVAEFERAFASFVGVKHAIATSSGTAALHTALLAHGVGPGHEVITTPFSFMATASAIVLTGARPVFVDVDDSFALDPALVEGAIGPRTRAILPVHLYGQPADLGALLVIARRHGLALIEDACQAHGAVFGGRRVGSFGTGCFSFYATKNMTTGEGGMLTTDDDRVAERARSAINHGRSGSAPYLHADIGNNYRLTEVAAAIGLAQLAKLADFNLRRAKNAAFYTERLSQLRGLTTPTVEPGREHVWHLYTLRVGPDFPLSRDVLIERLAASGVAAGVYYPLPLHRQAALRELVPAEASCLRADRLAREVLSIPVHPGLTESDRLRVAEALERLAKRGA